MAKIYQTPLDLRRDELKQDIEHKKYKEMMSNIIAVLGFSVAPSWYDNAAKAAKESAKGMSIFHKATSVFMFGIAAFGLVDAIRTHHERKQEEKDLKALGPEQVVLPADIRVIDPTMPTVIMSTTAMPQPIIQAGGQIHQGMLQDNLTQQKSF